ncbi:hypothetical protein AKJ16_DCAP19006 [Drosera capensis]
MSRRILELVHSSDDEIASCTAREQHQIDGEGLWRGKRYATEAYVLQVTEAEKNEPMESD